MREREGRFLIEGSREVRRALESGVVLEQLFISPELLPSEERLVREHVPAEVEVSELSSQAFTKVSYRQNPDGVLAVARTQARSLNDLSLAEDALVLIIDGLEKPGNVGALLRTADGAGLDAVFVTGAGTDLYNPNVIRASMGSLFSRPVLAVDTGELLTWLQARHFRIVATSPHAEQSYWQADYRQATAILLGREHEGLTENWLQVADTQVVIPMRGLADSLNVATAGALLIYEALRQRQRA